MRAKLLGILLATAAALPLMAGSADAAVFKWANNGDIRAMDPYTLNETVQNSLLSNIYEPLVRRNKKLEVEPALAVKWEQTSPVLWTFHLRPGVKWEDGSPLTAGDVAFSFKRISSKSSQLSDVVGSIKDVRRIDDMTVEIETKGPDPILLSELTSMPIMNEAWCVKNNSVEPAIVGTNENFALRNAMGTGSFHLTLREPDRRTVMEKSPSWWDKPEHNLDRFEFTVIGSDPTRVAALLSGEVDMIYSVPTQDMDRIAHTEGLKLIQGPELRTIYLGMDQARNELLFSDVKGKNPLKDKRVREAFALAIDENAIAKVVMRGQAKPTWELVGQGINGFDPALNTRPKTDPVKAKALLAEAGYPNGFSITLDCPNDRYVNDEAICTAISSMMAKAGIKVNVYARTKVKFFADTGYPNYNTSFYLLGWTPATYDAHNALKQLMETRGPAGHGIGNDGGYSNAHVDDLIEKIGVELDSKKRLAMISEATKTIQNDVGTIPLHQQTIVWAAKKNIELTQPADNSFPMRWVVVK
jgi:peptide/nickel transport system substrate-binding protein